MLRSSISAIGPLETRMEHSKLFRMERAIISRAPRRSRPDRVERVIEVKRREEAHRGRAWINGRPLGEVDPRIVHLYTTHD